MKWTGAFPLPRSRLFTLSSSRLFALSRSRLLALGLLVMLVGLVCLAIALPLDSARQANRERLEEMMHRLAQYQRVQATRPLMERNYARLQHWRSVENAYLNPGSGALAAADLQRIAKQHIASVNGDLISVRVNPVKEEGKFARISISIHMKADLADLVKLFYALETGKPVLFLDQVILRGLPSNASRRGGQGQALDIRFELIGYMRLETIG